MMDFSYALIGSRRAPSHITNLFIKVAYMRAQSGMYLVRSGAALSMDSTAEFGVWTHLISEGIEQDARKFINVFLPRIMFNGRFACRENGLIFLKDRTKAIEFSSGYHPVWSRLDNISKGRMARNANQIMGKDLNSPVSEVLCWTPDGSLGVKTSVDTGGTGQALRIAVAHNIPIINAGNPSHERYLKELTRNVKLPFKLTHKHLNKYRGYYESRREHFFR